MKKIYQSVLANFKSSITYQSGFFGGKRFGNPNQMEMCIYIYINDIIHLSAVMAKTSLGSTFSGFNTHLSKVVFWKICSMFFSKLVYSILVSYCQFNISLTV